MPTILRLALIDLSFLATAALVTISIVGPVSLTSMSGRWLTSFLVLSVIGMVWWGGYLWLLGQFGGGRLVECTRYAFASSLILSLTIIPDMVVLLSTRLPYTLPFEGATYSLLQWIAASIVGATVLAQEATLLEAARRESFQTLMGDAFAVAARFPGWLATLPGAVVRAARAHPLVAVLLLVGAAIRLVMIDVYHPGDMNALLASVYATLSWPPFGYYEAYRPQTWVYNHLPLFPVMAAPFYWVFENLLHIPTAWAVKGLTGAADLAVAVLLYRTVDGRWRKSAGLALAAVWLLAPWVISSDDHSIAPMVAFALGAYLARDRAWLCGLLLALSVAVRNEGAFVVAPLLFHFMAKRRLPETVAFIATLGTTLAIIVMPWVLYAPEPFDYALRGQLQRDGATQLSLLLGAALPYLGTQLGAVARQNQGMLAVLFSVIVSLLAIRDNRVTRVGVVAALGYLLLLPIVHARYTILAYGMGLLYAAIYSSPLVAALSIVAAWPDLGLSTPALVLTFVGMAIVGQIRPGKK